MPFGNSFEVELHSDHYRSRGRTASGSCSQPIEDLCRLQINGLFWIVSNLILYEILVRFLL
ncbi:hypothetical protein RHMOL_Rhmol07G0264100 [Rhododendron molle]|uniref:Uncharacterized protein n=1 Tax=Rhododendron molle TaxID=49168 RepID=A0ACC0N6N4_RHOML|nr:hypothetical protein RHMOL_Rhmol07G0264100 [Rhododendron molle]